MAVDSASARSRTYLALAGIVACGFALASGLFWLSEMRADILRWVTGNLIVTPFGLILFTAFCLTWIARVAIAGKLVKGMLTFTTPIVAGFLRMAMGASLLFLLLGFLGSLAFQKTASGHFITAFVLQAFMSLGMQLIAGIVINLMLIARHWRTPLPDGEG